MMMATRMRKEQIQGELIARTGFTTEARRCPIHRSALELVFDETERSTWSPGFPPLAGADDVNRVRWRCEVCVGSYTENYFVRDVGFRPPAARRLLLRCPLCGSRRVTHGCVPECCEQHVCADCNKGFEARVELVVRGDKMGSDDDDGPAHGVRDSKTRIPGTPALRSGFTRDFRRCPNAAHKKPLELVLLPMSEGDVADAPVLLGWYCAACSASFSESCFHHRERGFISDAAPAVGCPQCGSLHIELASEDGDGDARCGACGAQLRIHLES